MTDRTPKSLKALLASTCALSLASAFYYPLQGILGLSWAGIKSFYLFQIFSYVLIEPAPFGITFFFLFNLLINLYLIWIFGTSLLDRCRPRSFFTLYFGASALAALFALGLMASLNLPYLLAGSSTALYAVLIAWMMQNPDAQLLLFFAMPFRAKWLILGFLGLNLFLSLITADWIHLAAYSTSSLFGYIFALLSWGSESSLPFLRSFERALFRLKRKRSSPKPKVYDIRTKEPYLEDERFMDAMLAKISSQGEQSLSSEEKKRMQAISNRKAAERK